MLVDEMSQCLEDIILENCVVTLSQINGESRRRLPAKPLIHDRNVARNLEGMLFRVKLVRPLPSRNKQALCFAKKARIWKLVHEPCHYAHYNIWTARNHGRARQGERASTSMRPARMERDRGLSSIAG